MSTRHRDKKRTDSSTERYERSHHVVPWEWAFLGRHQADREGFSRFYAEQVCYEYILESTPNGPNAVDYRERNRLFVLYRNPETGEAVEREYGATTVESDDNRVAVPWPYDADGNRCDRGEWWRIKITGLEPDGLENTLVVPKGVFEGHPGHFRSSIMVSPDESRINPRGCE